jgi:hypothetical protein
MSWGTHVRSQLTDRAAYLTADRDWRPKSLAGLWGRVVFMWKNPPPTAKTEQDR